MSDLAKAKIQLDRVIRKARIHWYKPIQVAEILYRHRKVQAFNLDQLHVYRSASKGWRDSVSQRLIGRCSTSSARFQDNLFEPNAVPPHLIKVLAEENEKAGQEGVVEAYIYSQLAARYDSLARARVYVLQATTDSFDLRQFYDMFESAPGLKRSIDKVYEISAYALFTTLISHLQATMTVGVPETSLPLLADFDDFARIVLGINSDSPSHTIAAAVHRVGSTNAADRGLDMWANFGPAIQVKHVTLSPHITDGILREVSPTARVLVVCEAAEQRVIESVLSQVGYSYRLQGVVTFATLETWYVRCLDSKYGKSLGTALLHCLAEEFSSEFPATGNALLDFLEERGYAHVTLDGLWTIDVTEEPCGDPENGLLL